MLCKHVTAAAAAAQVTGRCTGAGLGGGGCRDPQVAPGGSERLRGRRATHVGGWRRGLLVMCCTFRAFGL